jgi:hypothetical protein
VQWTNYQVGDWKPMKRSESQPTAVRARHCVATWGWEVQKISDSLPAAEDDNEMLVDVSQLPASAIIGLEVSVVGDDAHERADILGFPVVQRQRSSNGTVTVEIEAFVIQDE